MGTSCFYKSQKEDITTNVNSPNTQSDSQCMGNKLHRAMTTKSSHDPMTVDDDTNDPMTIDLTNDDDVIINDDDQKDIDPPDSNQNANNINSNQTNTQQPPQPSAPQFKYVWQWVENDGTWHDYDATTQLLLDNLSIGNKITISAGGWMYDVTRTSTDQCSLCFVSILSISVLQTNQTLSEYTKS